MDATFSTIVTDEKQRGVIVKKFNSMTPTVDAAMVVRKAPSLRSESYNFEKYKFSKKGVKLNFNIRCDYCWFYDHAKDSCYHITGYLVKDENKGHASSSTAKKSKMDHANSAITHTVTDEEYRIMQNFFMKNAGSSHQGFDWTE